MTRQKRQLIVQYLGSRGVTLPCLQAVVTILASPYRCRNATVIFEKRAPGQTHSAVCFAVWDWLDHPVTIIPSLPLFPSSNNSRVTASPHPPVPPWVPNPFTIRNLLSASRNPAVQRNTCSPFCQHFTFLLAIRTLSFQGASSMTA